MISKANQLNGIYIMGLLVVNGLHTFFYKQLFYKRRQVEISKLNRLKIQTKAKQRPEAEVSLFETYSHNSSTLSSKNNRTYSKKLAKELV